MQQGKSSMAAPRSEGSVDCKQWFGTVFTNDKAGMAAVDREKVKKVVYKMSKVRERLAIIYPSEHGRKNLLSHLRRQDRVKVATSVVLLGDFRILHTSRTT